MNTIVDPKELYDVLKNIYARGHRVSYCIGDLESFSSEDMPEMVYHKTKDARFGKPAQGLSIADFAPPDQSLLSRLHDTESVVMTMLNRKVRPMVVDERKHFYYDLVRYWNGILDQHSPDLILFPAVPHSPFNFVLYSLARLRGIKTIIFHETMISDRLLIQHDYAPNSPLLEEKLHTNTDKKFKLDDISKDVREYITTQIDIGKDSTPLDVHILKEQSTTLKKILLRIRAIEKSLFDGSFFKKSYQYIYRLMGPNVQKEYVRNSSIPDFDIRYVYVPLHWQPECTTSPLGGIFVDQILALKILSFTLPLGWRIYVKEHPFQWHVQGVTHYSEYRYKGYYDRIKNIPNVSLVPIETDTYKLIRHARAVATIGGRATLEAVLRGKPAMIFGYPWFISVPGIFHVQNVSACREAFDCIESGYAPDMDKLIYYFKCFDEATSRVYLNKWGESQSTLTEEENKRNHLRLLIDEIARV